MEVTNNTNFNVVGLSWHKEFGLGAEHHIMPGQSVHVMGPSLRDIKGGPVTHQEQVGKIVCHEDQHNDHGYQVVLGRPLHFSPQISDAKVKFWLYHHEDTCAPEIFRSNGDGSFGQSSIQLIGTPEWENINGVGSWLMATQMAKNFYALKALDCVAVLKEEDISNQLHVTHLDQFFDPVKRLDRIHHFNKVVHGEQNPDVRYSQVEYQDARMNHIKKWLLMFVVPAGE